MKKFLCVLFVLSLFFIMASCSQDVCNDVPNSAVILDGNTLDYMQNTQFQRAIKDLPDGSTVILRNGDFRVAFLPEYHVPNNLTVIGEDTATVQEFAIEEDVTGLTLKNLKLTGVLSAAFTDNKVVTNLTIVGCSAKAIHLGKQGSIINATIKNCSFVDSDTSFNGITLNNIKGTTIVSNNTVENAADIGIAFLGTVSGNIKVENNIIDGTGDRALRVNQVLSGSIITFKSNIISDCAKAQSDGLIKITSTGKNASITFDGNTYMGNTWDPDDIGENKSNIIYSID